MPETNALLEQLRDIHLPPEPSWWPPAMGWWLLVGWLIIVAIVLWQYLHRRPGPVILFNQQVWSEFGRLQSDFATDADAGKFLTGLSSLIRRVAMSVSSREEVAKLTGDAWLDWLDKKAGKVLFMSDSGRIFAYAHYQSNAAFDSDAIAQVCKEWLVIISEKQSHASV